MKSLQILIAVIFVLALGLFAGASSSYALTYGLVPPAGPLTSGQNVDFTITIDTEGQSLTTATVGMTYQTNFMQYVSTASGGTMDQVNAQETTPGTIIFTATKSAGFKGAGDFAKVTFKVVATSDSNEICALFIPQSPAPTSPPSTTSAPAPTNLPPAPTALPKSGSLATSSLWEMIGVGGLLIFSGLYLFAKNPRHS